MNFAHLTVKLLCLVERDNVNVCAVFNVKLFGGNSTVGCDILDLIEEHGAEAGPIIDISGVSTSVHNMTYKRR